MVLYQRMHCLPLPWERQFAGSKEERHLRGRDSRDRQPWLLCFVCVCVGGVVLALSTPSLSQVYRAKRVPGTSAVD